GLTTVNGLRSIADLSGLVGGPVIADKWWFVASGRVSGSTLRAASLFHDADLDDWIPTNETTTISSGRRFNWGPRIGSVLRPTSSGTSGTRHSGNSIKGSRA